MAKAKAQPTKEEIAAKKAALKETVANFKEAVKGLKGYTFDIEGTDNGKGILLVEDGDKVIAQVSVKTVF